MASVEELEAISEKVSSLFQGIDLDEVAEVLKIQLAMLITQGADDLDDARTFLGEINEDVDAMLERFPFGEDDDGEEADDEADAEPGKAAGTA